MPYGKINGLDKKVSRVVMGTMVEGSVFMAAHGSQLFDDFFERGGNCYDTAWVYGGDYKSDQIVGRWVRSRGVRDQVVLIGKGAHTPDCYPEALTRQLHESLERMQLDGVDIYMMHRDNPEVPVGEFVDVLNEHKNAGRMKVFGGSNWSMTRVAEANEYAKSKGLQGFSCVSNNFSLARMTEAVWAGGISSSDAQSRAALEENQIAIFAWSSQARGFFVRADRNFTADKELTRSWYCDDNFERLNRVREMAKQKNALPIEIALAYVLNQPFPTFPLIGPRTPDEIRSSLSALSIKLSPDEVKYLNLEL